MDPWAGKATRDASASRNAGPRLQAAWHRSFAGWRCTLRWTGAKEEGPMSVRRLAHIPGFHIDRVAAAAGDDPDVFRLENLDTDLPPPAAVLRS
jgi:hypothetical protein